ncbi:MAG: hypothetical protein DI535_26155 [Citrobacter freundii]|nr:MAG: hypothetical protein DI535_26155 [Citrobacter freundii]
MGEKAHRTIFSESRYFEFEDGLFAAGVEVPADFADLTLTIQKACFNAGAYFYGKVQITQINF